MKTWSRHSVLTDLTQRSAMALARGDGSRSPFDQLAEIVDAVGDRIDVICDGGVRLGTHVLKALSVGAKACSGGRFYLCALA
jgi:L-lactate dehydrogenase (cytochrome)